MRVTLMLVTKNATSHTCTDRWQYFFGWSPSLRQDPRDPEGRTWTRSGCGWGGGGSGGKVVFGLRESKRYLAGWVGYSWYQTCPRTVAATPSSEVDFPNTSAALIISYQFKCIHNFAMLNSTSTAPFPFIFRTITLWQLLNSCCPLSINGLAPKLILPGPAWWNWLACNIIYRQSILD